LLRFLLIRLLLLFSPNLFSSRLYIHVMVDERHFLRLSIEISEWHCNYSRPLCLFFNGPFAVRTTLNCH
jgi:hypothetical protein